jgi:hypothetical protein
MVWAWFPANSRLTPPRILWGDYGYTPLVADKRRPLRAKPKIGKRRKTIWERRRWYHIHYAGRLGEWPRWCWTGGGRRGFELWTRLLGYPRHPSAGRGAIAGKNVMNWAPATYGSTAIRSATATPTDTNARA